MVSNAMRKWKWKTAQVVWADAEREWVPAEDAGELKKALEFFKAYPNTHEAQHRAAEALRRKEDK